MDDSSNEMYSCRKRSEKKEHLPNFTERKEKHVPGKGKVCIKGWKDEKG